MKYCNLKILKTQYLNRINCRTAERLRENKDKTQPLLENLSDIGKD